MLVWTLLVILLKELNIQDQAGWIVTDNHMKTAVDGIFAVGDVHQKDLRQVTTAVGDGISLVKKLINLSQNIVNTLLKSLQTTLASLYRRYGY